MTAGSSHPRRGATALLIALALLVFSAPVPAYEVRIPDFLQLEKQLRLAPLQKAQFDIAVEASRRALLAAALAGLQVKERLNQELSKPVPDLNVLFRMHEEVIEMAAPSFREAAGEWERLFRMLDRRQVEAAKRFLRENLGPYSYGVI
jgi:hypothetical protein